MHMLLKKEEILHAQPISHLHTPDAIIGHNDGKHENESECLTQHEWLLHNIPFIETPDSLLDQVYYFRWRNLLACLGKRKSDGLYEFCESGPSSQYHTYIDCAEGAHIREARWIRDTKYLNDYIAITPEKVNYREYITDSVYQKYLLDGDLHCLQQNYEKLKARFHSLDHTFDPDFGLYHCHNGVEGQEAGVNGFEKIERGFTYAATFTAGGTSLAALTDRDTSGAYWSCEGSGHPKDSIEIDLHRTDITVTGLFVWFRTQPKNLTVSYLDGETWKPVQGLHIKKNASDAKKTEIIFEKVLTSNIQIAFENTPQACATVYELLVCYTFEPWGCPGFWEVISGDESYRVNLNTFQAAAAYALSKIADTMGNTAEATLYRQKGDALKTAIFEKLWQDDISYFAEITYPERRRIIGKESNNYSAWSFGLTPDAERYHKAWDYAVSEDIFLAKFGLTTLEKKNPHYMQPFGHACLWNGPVWPYTFSLCLTGMANLLCDYKAHSVTREQYYDLLYRFATCHFDNHSTKEFVVRENHHPEENRWLAQAKDYNHSTFVDNVLSGLLGVRPDEEKLVIHPLIPDSWEYFCLTDVCWCGKNLTVVYDKTGKKYQVGQGLMVFVDDRLVQRTDDLQKIVLLKSEI